MQNIKYQLLNISTVTLFSYVLAITISHFIRLRLTPDNVAISGKRVKVIRKTNNKSFEDYSSILDSAFFKIVDNSGDDPGKGEADPSEFLPGGLKDLRLLGTLTGHSNIARALIRKRNERKSEIFKLWNDVYGYKLVKIGNSKAYLKKGETTEVLDMYDFDESWKTPTSSRQPARRLSSLPARSYSISRAEIQQKVLGNLDNALRGLVAGPYRINNRIEGWRLRRVRPYNIAYKYGFRSGDIIKRVNGHVIDSTQKLLSIWEAVKSGETKVSIDIERRNKLQTIDLNITN